MRPVRGSGPYLDHGVVLIDDCDRLGFLAVRLGAGLSQPREIVRQFIGLDRQETGLHDGVEVVGW
jgi:hypothetical protein